MTLLPQSFEKVEAKNNNGLNKLLRKGGQPDGRKTKK
jgi:hypothetical protein